MSADSRTSFASRRRGVLASTPPSAALEITSRRVTGLTIGTHSGATVIASYAAEGMPDGTIDPTLNAPNIQQGGVLAAAIKTVADKLSPRPRRIALVLPDTVAKVSLVRFEKVPAKVQDLDQLIRWQVRKAAPFRVEDAQVAWSPGLALGDNGREYIVTMARRDIVEGYERACDDAGVHAGVIDVASFNLINAVLASNGATGAGDWLLVNLAADYATLAVVRAGDLVFFRNRAGAATADLVDLVHQTAMYHEDRLGGGKFTRVVLTGASSRGAEHADWVRRAIEERLAARVQPLDFGGAVAMRERITVQPELLDALAPALGVLLRDRRAGARGKSERIA